MSDELDKIPQNENALIRNQDILQLVRKVMDNLAEERALALEMYKRLTGAGDFDKIADVMYKGETVSKMLELTTKATGELNKLLSTIQKFSSDKVESENVDKILSAEHIGGILDALDVLKVGPNKFTGNAVRQEIVNQIKQVQQNYKDKNGVDVEFSDMEDINE
jgi:hypothetical protein